MKVWAQKELVQAHWNWVGAVLNKSSSLLKFVGTILQVRRDGMDHPLGLCLSYRPQTHFHVGCEPMHLFHLVGPEM